MSSILALRALEIAKTQIGVHEIPAGSNFGPDVMKYLNSVGLTKPNSWCLSFIYWCFQQAANELGISSPLYKTGGVLLEWQKSKSEFGVLTNPVPGDVFILNHGKGLGHAGIIESVNPYTHAAHTIEGNSNNTGSRDGEEVVWHSRTDKEPGLEGYLRFY